MPRALGTGAATVAEDFAYDGASRLVSHSTAVGQAGASLAAPVAPTSPALLATAAYALDARGRASREFASPTGRLLRHTSDAAGRLARTEDLSAASATDFLFVGARYAGARARGRPRRRAAHAPRLRRARPARLDAHCRRRPRRAGRAARRGVGEYVLRRRLGRGRVRSTTVAG